MITSFESTDAFPPLLSVAAEVSTTDWTVLETASTNGRSTCDEARCSSFSVDVDVDDNEDEDEVMGMDDDVGRVDWTKG